MTKTITNGFGYSDGKIMIVEESPSSEELLMGAPLCSLAGKHFASLLREAKVNPRLVYYTFAIRHCCTGQLTSKQFSDEFKPYREALWKEMNTVKPEIVLALGKHVSQSLLRVKRGLKLAEVGGKPQKLEYFPAQCIPWYRPHWILQNGKKAAEKTVEMLQKHLTPLKSNGNNT